MPSVRAWHFRRDSPLRERIVTGLPTSILVRQDGVPNSLLLLCTRSSFVSSHVRDDPQQGAPLTVTSMKAHSGTRVPSGTEFENLGHPSEHELGQTSGQKRRTFVEGRRKCSCATTFSTYISTIIVISLVRRHGKARNDRGKRTYENQSAP